MSEKKKYNVDLFTFFDKANEGDMRYVDSLTDEEVKTINPYVLMMWAQGASTNREIHSIMTDLYVNDKVFSLSHHPRLLLKLFIAANGDIDNARYRFVKPKGRVANKKLNLISEYYRCTIREAEDYARILTDEDISHLESIMEE